MAVQIGQGAPYAPHAVIATVLKRNRENSIPQPVDLGVLQRLGISESLSPRTLQSLKLLDFVADDGNLTDDFANLRKVPTPEYLPKVAEMLRGTYADVFAIVNPSGATYEAVKDAFRGFTPPSQIDRMASLFLGLLTYTEQWDNLPSSRTSKPAATKARTTKTTKPLAPKVDKPIDPAPFIPPLQSEFSKTVKLDGAAGTVTLSVDVNPIKLKGDARTFFYALVDMLDEYENKTSSPNAAG